MPTITKTKQMPLTSKNGLTPSKTDSILDRLESGWDVNDTIKMLLYGLSGSGKTVMWSTFPGPILSIICSGGRKPGEMKSINTPELRSKITPAIITSIADCKELIDLAPKYTTVVLDHASGLEDLALMEAMGVTELPAGKSFGMAKREHYGQASMQCKEILRALLSLDCHVVIVAQERAFTPNEDEPSEIIQTTVGASITPGLRRWLTPAADNVCQMFKRAKMETTTTKIAGKDIATTKRGKGVEYCLRTEPHEVYDSKIRTAHPDKLPDCITNPSFAKLMKVMKGEK